MHKFSENRFYGLDLVKVVAIVWICLYHLLDFHNGWKVGTIYGSGSYWEFFSFGGGILQTLSMVLISLGVIGVNLFIIASGAGLSASANRRKIGYLTFFKKRIVKIFPYYWFILTGILLFELILGHQVNYFDYFVHFFGINNFFPEYVLTISAPFWFIGTIFQLYLLFPLIFRLSKKIHPILLLLAAVLLKVYIDPVLIDFFGGGRFFTEYIIDFVVGVIIGNIIIQRRLAYSPVQIVLFSFALIFSLCFIVFVNLYTVYHLFLPLIYQVAAALLFVIIFACARILPKKVLTFFAYASSLSFVIFLTHYYFLTKFFSKFFPKFVFKLPFLIESIIFLLFSFILALLINWFINLFFTHKNPSSS